MIKVLKSEDVINHYVIGALTLYAYIPKVQDNSNAEPSNLLSTINNGKVFLWNIPCQAFDPTFYRLRSTNCRGQFAISSDILLILVYLFYI